MSELEWKVGYELSEWELLLVKQLGSGQDWDQTMVRQKAGCWVPLLWGSEDVVEKRTAKRTGERRM